MKEEIWKDIVGFEGKYQISNYGNVKSLNYKKKGVPHLLKPIFTKDGYKQVSINQKMRYVHRLVAEHFIDNIDNKKQVNHKDEYKQNNCVDNLEWVTQKENLNYGTRNQRCAKGNQKKIIMIYLKENKEPIIFDSLIMASTETGFYYGVISDILCGRRLTVDKGKYTFRYL